MSSKSSKRRVVPMYGTTLTVSDANRVEAGTIYVTEETLAELEAASGYAEWASILQASMGEQANTLALDPENLNRA